MCVYIYIRPYIFRSYGRSEVGHVTIYVFTKAPTFHHYENALNFHYRKWLKKVGSFGLSYTGISGLGVGRKDLSTLINIPLSFDLLADTTQGCWTCQQLDWNRHEDQIEWFIFWHRSSGRRKRYVRRNTKSFIRSRGREKCWSDAPLAPGRSRRREKKTFFRLRPRKEHLEILTIPTAKLLSVGIAKVCHF